MKLKSQAPCSWHFGTQDHESPLTVICLPNLFQRQHASDRIINFLPSHIYPFLYQFPVAAEGRAKQNKQNDVKKMMQSHRLSEGRTAVCFTCVRGSNDRITVQESSVSSEASMLRVQSDVYVFAICMCISVLSVLDYLDQAAATLKVLNFITFPKDCLPNIVTIWPQLRLYNFFIFSLLIIFNSQL